jgi:cell wall-associated NlpC family hydrolase
MAEQICEVIEPQAPLRHAPSPDAPLGTEALKGERVIVYETTDEGWAHGRLEADGYVGYLPTSALSPPGPAPTHKVAALRTLVFPGPSIKLPPVEALPLGAKVAVARVDGPFVIIASGGYVPARHLATLDARETDFVAVAERFLGAPYLWGGKTSLGLDCSGLVQVALAACGVASPRDSHVQERALGRSLALSAEGRLGRALRETQHFETATRDSATVGSRKELDPTYELRRGDLMFWTGHVAIVRDEATLIHANAFHMAVVIEPIVEAIERIRTAGSEVTSVRRL